MNRMFSQPGDLLTLLVSVCLLCVNSAIAVEYRFTNIADTTTAAPLGTFSNLGAGVDSMQLFTHNPPAISGLSVAFYGRYTGNHGIFVGDGGPLVTIAKTGDPAPAGTFSQLSDMTISNDVVAFHGRFAPAGQSTQDGVFSGNGGTLTTIAKAGDPVPSGIFLSAVNPSISGAKVLFGGSDATGSGVFLNSSGLTTAVIR